ncbi:hypothetical protein HanIR_Chr07g0312731 [Helianthus annuus]|nr:hypothetical protein HanIR_Chr07g0312731 [Helianthus annuus]
MRSNIQIWYKIDVEEMPQTLLDLRPPNPNAYKVLEGDEFVAKHDLMKMNHVVCSKPRQVNLFSSTLNGPAMN